MLARRTVLAVLSLVCLTACRYQLSAISAATVRLPPMPPRLLSGSLTCAQHANVASGGGEFGDGLCALRHRMLGQLAWQDEAHSGLNLA